MSMSAEPWQVVLRPHRAQAPIYVGPENEPVYCDLFGPGQIRAERDFKARIDGQTELRATECDFAERAVILEPLQGALLEALPAFPSPIDATSLSGKQVEGAGWITSTQADVIVDEMSQFSPEETALSPIPFLDGVISDSPFQYVSIESTFAECLHVSAQSLKEEASLSAIKNTSRPLVIPAPDGTEEQGVMQLNDMSFTFDVPTSHATLVIDRVYDRFHGRQRARVIVSDCADGRAISDSLWYDQSESRSDRLAKSRFVASIGEHSGNLLLTIAPPSGAPLWSFVSYRIRSYP